MDMIVILYSGLGTGAALAGYALVVLARRPRKPTLPEARCSCGHGAGTHDEDGCGDQVQRPVEWRRDNGRATGWDYEPCPCRRYDGPDPEQLRLMRGA